MNLVAARDAEPDRIYRCVRHEVDGVYVQRVPRAAARRIVRRLATSNPNTMKPRDSWLRRQLPRLEGGDAVLFRRFIRGVDVSSGDRYEISSLVAVPADYEFREVKRRPGY